MALVKIRHKKTKEERTVTTTVAEIIKKDWEVLKDNKFKHPVNDGFKKNEVKPLETDVK